jgi:hypothetical protein
MFSSLITTSLPLLTLSAQKHNMLNAGMIEDITRMMEREKWTCHVCGTQLNGLMEVDHLKGHSLKGASGIRPICQFCHDRKHPVWAASQGRLSVIHAPDLSHEEISQISWALLLHKKNTDFSIDVKRLDRELRARREDAFDAIGHENPESIFESIFAIRDIKGDKETMSILEEMDKHLRFIPSAVFSEDPEITSWGDGGFRKLPEGWQERAIPKGLPAMDVMREAGTALKSRL